MSVPASKKEKAKVEFITNGQHLLIDIGNWVDSQKSIGKSTALDDFFNLASRAYICMSTANSVKITDIDTYAMRTDHFKKAKSYYRALREYLTVIATMYQIKKKRKRDWSDCLYYIDIELRGVLKSDIKVLQKAVGKYNKTAKTINQMLDEYNNRQIKKRAAINRRRSEEIFKSIDKGEITENRNMNQNLQQAEKAEALKEKVKNQNDSKVKDKTKKEQIDSKDK